MTYHLSSFSRGGYDRRDYVICGGFRGGLRGGSGFHVDFAADLGFAWASRLIWVSRWASRRSWWVLSSLSQPPRSGLSCLDSISALSLPSQIRSQLERRRRCRPRSGLSWREEGGGTVLLGCDSGGVGVWGGLPRWWWVFYVCVFFYFTFHQTL